MKTRMPDPRDLVDDSIWYSRARRTRGAADSGRITHALRLTIVAALASVGLVVWLS